MRSSCSNRGRQIKLRPGVFDRTQSLLKSLCDANSLLRNASFADGLLAKFIDKPGQTAHEFGWGFVYIEAKLGFDRSPDGSTRIAPLSPDLPMKIEQRRAVIRGVFAHAVQETVEARCHIDGRNHADVARLEPHRCR